MGAYHPGLSPTRSPQDSEEEVLGSTQPAPSLIHVCPLALFYPHIPFTSGDLLFEYKDANAILLCFLVLLLHVLAKLHHTQTEFLLFFCMQEKATERLCNNQAEKKPTARVQTLSKWAMTSQIKKTV